MNVRDVRSWDRPPIKGDLSPLRSLRPSLPLLRAPRFSEVLGSLRQSVSGRKLEFVFEATRSGFPFLSFPLCFFTRSRLRTRLREARETSKTTARSSRIRTDVRALRVRRALDSGRVRIIFNRVKPRPFFSRILRLLARGIRGIVRSKSSRHYTAGANMFLNQDFTSP